MAIQIICTFCGTSATLHDWEVGKHGKCKKCGKPLQLPTPEVELPITQYDDLSYKWAKFSSTLIGWTVAAVLGVVGSFVILVNIDNFVSGRAVLKLSAAALLIAIWIGVVIWLARMLIGGDTKCPKCGRKWAKVGVRSEDLGTSTNFTTVDRTDYIRSADDYRIHATVRRQEQVAVVHGHSRHHCRCRFCEHRWIDDETKKISS